MIKTKDILHIDISHIGDKVLAKEGTGFKFSDGYDYVINIPNCKLNSELLAVTNEFDSWSMEDLCAGFNKYVTANKYPNGFTENGEDGVLLQLFKEIGVTSKNAIEVGAGDGFKYSVTADLRLNHGWMGYLIDGFAPVNKVVRVSRDERPELFTNIRGWPSHPDHTKGNSALIISEDRTDLSSADASERDIDNAVLKNNDPEFSKHSYFIKKMVTRENVNDTLSAHNVPNEIDLLTIDIDSIDWYIWKEIGPRARVVMIEYNPNILPTIDAVIKYDPDFKVTRKDAYRGASIRALYNLGKSMGYTLIHALNCNLIFVKNEEVEKIKTEIPFKDDLVILYGMSAYFYEPYFHHPVRHMTILRSEKYKNDERLWVSSSELI